MKRKNVTILSLWLLSYSFLLGQTRNEVFNAYIEKYSKLAIQHQKKYKVPASITLAQGLLESSAGRSKLATQANNHFGIKCGNNWDGQTIKHYHSGKSDCYRKYSSTKRSFKDHSLFLARQSRYAFLFKLDPTDYKGWAYGLKKAGYATDKAYPQKLIRIIQNFNLQRFDVKEKKEDNQLLIEEEHLSAKRKKIDKPYKPRINYGNKPYNPGRSYKKHKWNTTIPVALMSHSIFRNNGVKCILTEDGDSFDSIAYEFKIKKNKLLYYNDLVEDRRILPKTVIYIAKKKKKAQKENPLFHKIRKGDSMYKIAQKYGIRLKALYDLNELPYNYIPMIDKVLVLR